MPILDCVEMVNIWPTVGGVELRKGSSAHATGFAGPVLTLMPYSWTSSSLWAATASGIFNATTAGAVGSAAIACANGVFSHTNFANAAGNWLVAVNGVDELRLYNGTAWQAVNGSSSPISITGLATSDLSAVTVFKRRLFFARKNTLDIYYLPIDSVGGALTILPTSSMFSRGGQIIAADNWTLDGGRGPTDYLVLVSSRGEVVVYSGIDPSSDFSVVGTFFVGIPVGPRCLEKLGGDLVMFTQNGVIPLSALMQSSTVGRTEALSLKIQSAFSEVARLYGYATGWQIVNFAEENALLVNIPASSGNQQQYVMNTITKAWTAFRGWSANCFAIHLGRLYYGGANSVVRAWSGTSDNGVAITGWAQQAYNMFKRQGGKQITLSRIHVATSSKVNLRLGFYTDFEQPGATTQIQQGQVSSSLWDTAVWDSSTWGGDLAQLQTQWLTIPMKPAYFISLRLQVQSASATFTWTSTDFVLKPAGIL
jgi:hypothetical protein